MSYSTLCAVYRTTATGLAEYRNSWGTGPLIWDYLSKRYLGHKKSWMLLDNALWDLATDMNVPASLRACHAITFDRGIVPFEYAQKMADLLRSGSEILSKGAPDHVNHFSSIADDLGKIKLRKNALGFGLNCTSVSDVWLHGAWPGKPRKEAFDCFKYARLGELI
ncbi:hypothetical protein [Komagataeibacter oboediens]|uniref:hypothetical protein n=1 Tax=Komagataeibacter oboediens TaxID=65958 RepID=UPI000237E3E3|nr:hypothetical protein [Komagataeibacter oboediens]